MDSVFDIIEAIIEGKRAAKKPPFIALYPEIAAHYSGPDLQGELAVWSMPECSFAGRRSIARITN